MNLLLSNLNGDQHVSELGRSLYDIHDSRCVGFSIRACNRSVQVMCSNSAAMRFKYPERITCFVFAAAKIRDHELI